MSGEFQDDIGWSLYLVFDLSLFDNLFQREKLKYESFAFVFTNLTFVRMRHFCKIHIEVLAYLSILLKGSRNLDYYREL